MIYGNWVGVVFFRVRVNLFTLRLNHSVNLDLVMMPVLLMTLRYWSKLNWAVYGGKLLNRELTTFQQNMWYFSFESVDILYDNISRISNIFPSFFDWNSEITLYKGINVYKKQYHTMEPPNLLRAKDSYIYIDIYTLCYYNGGHQYQSLCPTVYVHCGKTIL